MSLYPPTRAAFRMPSSGWLSAAALAVAAGYVLLAGRLMATASFDIWGGLMFAPLLVLATIPLLRHWQRDLGLEWFTALATAGLVMKLVGSVARWYVVFQMYGGEGDSARYHEAGIKYANQIQQGQFPPLLGNTGSGFVDSLTGLLYAVTGVSLLGGFVVFAWFGFIGQLLVIRAFVEAVPDGSHKRYAALVFFLPSLVFWPSSIGKESWMLLGIGAAMLGAARLLTAPPRGIVSLTLGLGATAMVRPHVTMLLAAAGVTAFAVGRTSGTISRPVKIAMLGALGVATWLLIQMAAQYVGVDELSVKGVSDAWESRSGNTEVGGSSFSAKPVSGPLDLPMAVVTLVLRPFPWEAGGLMPLLASLEGVLLGGLILLTIATTPRLLSQLRANPYVTFCLTYLLAYAVLFSGFANFAILVRQRTLAMPAMLVLLCLPAVQRAGSHVRGRSRARRPGGAGGDDGVASATAPLDAAPVALGAARGHP